MCTKDFNIKPNTLNLIKYTVVESLKILLIANNNLKEYLIQNVLRPTIYKCDLITLKSSGKQRTLPMRE